MFALVSPESFAFNCGANLLEAQTKAGTVILPIVVENNEGQQPIPECYRLDQTSQVMASVRSYYELFRISNKSDRKGLFTVNYEEFLRVARPLEDLLLSQLNLRVHCTSGARVGPVYLKSWVKKAPNVLMRLFDEQTIFVKMLIARELLDKGVIADAIPVYLKGKPLDDWLEIVPFRVQSMEEVDQQDEFRICRFAPHRYLLAPSTGHEIFDWAKIWPIELKPVT